MKSLKSLFKNRLVATIIISSLVSAVVGGVFGYYGATLVDQNLSPVIRQIAGRGVPDESAKVAKEEEEIVVAMVKRVTPAVVSIAGTKDLTIVERQGVYNPFEEFCKDPFFRRFLGSQCDIQSQPPKTRTEKQQVSAGSGFIISSDGLILTNKHVVDVSGADFTVITSSGKKYPARILAKDPIQDLAVLKIDAAGLSTLKLGDSDKLQIGQTVIAIGNALGQFSNTVSKGVISGLSRSIVALESSGRSEKLEQVIQTDAAINPGNSGGPLLNLSGEVVGINTAIAQGAQNVGFAIPINQAKRGIEQVKTTGKISYPFLGIRYVIVTDDIKQKNNLPVDYGALIVKGQTQAEPAVVPGSPADKAGLKEGDIILEIGGKKITAENDLAHLLQNFKPGDSVALKVLSQGQEKIIKVTLEERK